MTAADGTLRTGWVEDRIDGFITKRRLDGSEEWRTSFEGADARYPCVAADGTVILWINSSYRKGMFIAVDPKGQIAWKLPIEEHASPPAVGADGTLYFTVRDRLRAVDRQGRSKWELPIDDDDTVSQLPPTVGPEGTIYVESRDSNRRWGLLAVAASGQKKWHFVATDSDSLQLLARPNFAPDGTILVGYRELNVHDGKLYALSSAGAKKWEVLVGDMQQRRATIDADGVTYVCGSALYAIAPDGKKLWKAGISGEFSPVLGRDGDIYVVDVFGTLTRVKRDGTVAGSARFSSSRTAAAFEHGADQTMHIYFHSGELYVVDYSLF